MICRIIDNASFLFPHTSSFSGSLLSSSTSYVAGGNLGVNDIKVSVFTPDSSVVREYLYRKRNQCQSKYYATMNQHTFCGIYTAIGN